ncbi:MAG: hypothetical protein NDI81_12650 [Desulfobacula sp.]|nr:hypothetical protein [Desulfobacula sp.]
MTGSFKINGIRLNRKFIQVTQEDFLSPPPLYEVAESGKMNMVCMVLSTLGDRPFVSGTLASSCFGQLVNRNPQWQCLSHVCTLSVYPHHYSLEFLGALLHMLGTQKQGFHYLVSSHSMLTFVACEAQVAGLIHMLSTGFDLPETHAPFEQEENDELTLFIKKKYPETRATYVEERIKTYGMTLVKDVYLRGYEFSFEDLSMFGKKIEDQGKGERFSHITAYMTPDQQILLYPVTGKPHDSFGGILCPAELLSFYGPHFGDRYGIMSRALKCLFRHDIHVLQAGCTGASICMVLPKGRGEAAEQALKEVFENP